MGEGVRASLTLYRLAADQGNAAGQVNLGVLYQEGRGGLTKNERETARLFRLAADQGFAPGQVNLGRFYEEGRGGSQRMSARPLASFASQLGAETPMHSGV